MFIKTFTLTLKRQIRDKESMAMLLLFPIVLILVLGNSLSGAFSPSSISRIKVAYLNEDMGEIGRHLDSFIYSDEMKEYLEVYAGGSAFKGREMVSNGDVKAFVYIDENYTSDIMAGKGADINIVIQTSSQVDLAVIEGIFDSFNNSLSTVNALIVNGLEPIEPVMTDATVSIPVSKNGKVPGAIDYYAVTMLVMTLMYGTLYGGIGMGRVFYENLGKRIQTTPVSKFKLYSATIFGFMATIFIQGTIILFFTKYIYGAYWGENIALIMIIIFVMSFFTISLGTFVGITARDYKTTVAILQILVPVATFISSGYFKFQMPNPAIRNIVSSIVPNAMAQTAIFNTIYDGPAYETNKMLLIMAAAGIVFIFGAVAAGRRKSA